MDAGAQGAMTTEEVEVVDDAAIQVGSFQVTFRDEAGAEVSQSGKFITILTREDDGAWRIYRDIWNYDTE